MASLEKSTCESSAHRIVHKAVGLDGTQAGLERKGRRGVFQHLRR